MDTDITTVETYVTATALDLDTKDIITALHIDNDNDEEINNALIYKSSAEAYLAGAGIKKDYSNSLYKHLVIVLIARALERNTLLSNFADMVGNGLIPMVAQLRLTQKLESGADV